MSAGLLAVLEGKARCMYHVERRTNAVFEDGLVERALALGQEERLHDNQWDEVRGKDKEAHGSHSPGEGDLEYELPENDRVDDRA